MTIIVKQKCQSIIKQSWNMQNPTTTDLPEEMTNHPAIKFLRQWLPFIAIFLCLLVYLRTLNYEFVVDDIFQCKNNPRLESWSFVPGYFKTHIFGQFSQYSNNFYRPIFVLWCFINRQLFHDWATGWHMTTLGLHLLITWQVYWLGWKISQEQLLGGVASLLFALHPIHLEDVAYISGVTEQLVAAPLLAALICHIKYRSSGNSKWLAGALALFLVAAFSKESAIVLPIFVFAFDWLFQRKNEENRHESFMRLAPAAGLFAAAEFFYLFCRVRALGQINQTLTNIPWKTVFLTIPSIFWFYVKKIIWPTELSLYYITDYVDFPRWATFWIPLLGVLLVMLTFSLITLRSSHSRILIFSAMVMVLPIMPVLNFRGFLFREIAHDRYLYLPCMGYSITLAVLLIYGIPWIAQKHKARAIPVFLVVTGSLTAFFCTTTYLQSSSWKNELTVYANSVRIAPDNFYAVIGMGNALSDIGALPEATAWYRHAVQLSPSHRTTRMTLGELLLRQKKGADAQEAFQDAIVLDGGRSVSEHVRLGESLRMQNKYFEAANAFREAALLDPNSAEIRVMLGQVLWSAGMKAEAIRSFQDALVVDPSYGPAKAELKITTNIGNKK